MIGREFILRAAQAISSLPDAALQSSLAQLVKPGWFQRGLPPRASLHFQARARPGRGLRRPCFEASANAASGNHRGAQSFPTADRPRARWSSLPITAPRLATERAISYWSAAGERACRALGSAEAVGHFLARKRTRNNRGQPDSCASSSSSSCSRSARRLITTQGPGTPDVQPGLWASAGNLRGAARVRALHFAAHWGCWRISKDLREGRQRANDLLRLARELNDPGLCCRRTIASGRRSSSWRSYGLLRPRRGGPGTLRPRAARPPGQPLRRPRPEGLRPRRTGAALWLLGLSGEALRSADAGLAYAHDLAQAGSPRAQHGPDGHAAPLSTRRPGECSRSKPDDGLQRRAGTCAITRPKASSSAAGRARCWASRRRGAGDGGGGRGAAGDGHDRGLPGLLRHARRGVGSASTASTRPARRSSARSKRRKAAASLTGTQSCTGGAASSSGGGGPSRRGGARGSRAGLRAGPGAGRPLARTAGGHDRVPHGRGRHRDADGAGRSAPRLRAFSRRSRHRPISKKRRVARHGPAVTAAGGPGGQPAEALHAGAPIAIVPPEATLARFGPCCRHGYHPDRECHRPGPDRHPGGHGQPAELPLALARQARASSRGGQGIGRDGSDELYHAETSRSRSSSRASASSATITWSTPAAALCAGSRWRDDLTILWIEGQDLLSGTVPLAAARAREHQLHGAAARQAAAALPPAPMVSPRATVLPKRSAMASAS